MEFKLLFLLITLALCYNPDAAVNYALSYCDNYNPNFANYADMGGDCANFVSQALMAGGLDLSGCAVSWRDAYGCLPRVADVMSCLDQLGWKSSYSVPPGFSGGYPLFLTDGSHAMIASSFDGSTVYYCGHTYDRCGEPAYFNAIYYYP